MTSKRSTGRRFFLCYCRGKKGRDVGSRLELLLERFKINTDRRKKRTEGGQEQQRTGESGGRMARRKGGALRRAKGDISGDQDIKSPDIEGGNLGQTASRMKEEGRRRKMCGKSSAEEPTEDLCLYLQHLLKKEKQQQRDRRWGVAEYVSNNRSRKSSPGCRKDRRGEAKRS